MMRKKICILGTGNIGADLLVKYSNNPNFEIHSFVGRNFDSNGMLFCKKKYPKIIRSDMSIDFIKNHHNEIDILVDCTNAKNHIRNNEFYKSCNFKVIDMTPSKIGLLTVPDLIDPSIIGNHDNFNLISCGGQTSIPISHTIAKNITDIDYLEVVSSISSKSAGPATRSNIDEYIETTELALAFFTGLQRENVKVILIVNPAVPEIDMQTSIYFTTKSIVNIKQVSKSIDKKVKNVNSYVPGYRLAFPLTKVGEKYILSLKVSGSGDYLPSYAGNLDIINWACIKLSEKL
jgi:acetaldehyde dehydrogenase (acetylating)